MLVLERAREAWSHAVTAYLASPPGEWEPALGECLELLDLGGESHTLASQRLRLWALSLLPQQSVTCILQIKKLLKTCAEQYGPGSHDALRAEMLGLVEALSNRRQLSGSGGGGSTPPPPIDDEEDPVRRVLRQTLCFDPQPHLDPEAEVVVTPEEMRDGPFRREVEEAARLREAGEWHAAAALYERLYYTAYDHGWRETAVELYVGLAVCRWAADEGASLRSRGAVAKAHRLVAAAGLPPSASEALPPPPPSTADSDSSEDVLAQQQASSLWRQGAVELGFACDLDNLGSTNEEYEAARSLFRQAATCLLDHRRRAPERERDLFVAQMIARQSMRCDTLEDLRQIVEDAFDGEEDRVPAWLLRWWEIANALCYSVYLHVHDEDDEALLDGASSL